MNDDALVPEQEAGNRATVDCLEGRLAKDQASTLGRGVSEWF
jgi:hypothetical protein